MGSNNKSNGDSKLVWIWTENKQVMTTAVERGWSTFIFDANSADLAKDWSCEFAQLFYFTTFAILYSNLHYRGFLSEIGGLQLLNLGPQWFCLLRIGEIEKTNKLIYSRKFNGKGNIGTDLKTQGWHVEFS